MLRLNGVCGFSPSGMGNGGLLSDERPPFFLADVLGQTPCEDAPVFLHGGQLLTQIILLEHIEPFELHIAVDEGFQLFELLAQFFLLALEARDEGLRLAGFLFLAVVMDAWSRRIVGWAFSADLKTRVVLDALDMALAARKPENVIHHSDQGSQYTSLAFGNRCRDAGVRPSTGSR